MKPPLWLRVAEALRSESMPPEGEPRPDAEELESINAWLDGAMAGATAAQAGLRSAGSTGRNTTTRFAT